MNWILPLLNILLRDTPVLLKADGYFLQFKAQTNTSMCDDKAVTSNLWAQSFCNTLSLLGAALIWPNRSIWLVFMGVFLVFCFLWVFLSENDSLYLCSQFVEALLMWAWSSGTVAFPAIRAVLAPAGFGTLGAPCGCLPWWAVALRAHISVFPKTHPPCVCRSPGLGTMGWQAGRGKGPWKKNNQETPAQKDLLN